MLPATAPPRSPPPPPRLPPWHPSSVRGRGSESEQATRGPRRCPSRRSSASRASSMGNIDAADPSSPSPVSSLRGALQRFARRRRRCARARPAALPRRVHPVLDRLHPWGVPGQVVKAVLQRYHQLQWLTLLQSNCIPNLSLAAVTIKSSLLRHQFFHNTLSMFDGMGTRTLRVCESLLGRQTRGRCMEMMPRPTGGRGNGDKAHKEGAVAKSIFDAEF